MAEVGTHMLKQLPGHSAHKRKRLKPPRVLKSPRGRAEEEGKDIERSQTWFNPWLGCSHAAIDALVVRAVRALEQTLAESHIRKRREADQKSLLALARRLVANAAYPVALGLVPPTVAISLGKPMGKRSRYDAPALGQLDAALKALSPGLIAVQTSRRKGVSSSMQAGGELLDCIAGLGAEFHHGCFRVAGGEAVIVWRVEKNYALGKQARIRTPVDYADTEETLRYRAELERINGVLEVADLEFDHPTRPSVDIGRRRLRRIFSSPDGRPRFDLNGRLYGGWWQDVPRADRHGIRIDGLGVADLDFRTMFLRLAYATAGAPAPPDDEDLYAGILGGADDALHREGLKVIVNAMLERPTPLRRLPQGSPELLPKGCKASVIRAAVLRGHQPIGEMLEAGLGLNLMKLESDILVSILLRLMDRGIAALPMHDGLMVRFDAAEEAGRVMREVSREMTGWELPVKAARLGV